MTSKNEAITKLVYGVLLDQQPALYRLRWRGVVTFELRVGMTHVAEWYDVAEWHEEDRWSFYHQSSLPEYGPKYLPAEEALTLVNKFWNISIDGRKDIQNEP